MTGKQTRSFPPIQAILDSPATRDSLATSLRRIETLTALLRAPSHRRPCEPLDAEVVGEAAGMIAEEAARMRAALDPHLITRE